ncbi:MAG TPA: hypothetical protein DHW71_09795, partial [Gammaproteobacteria bacterium]|nr:hypothetical protein [Gammaproteobacteria bacterium]
MPTTDQIPLHLIRTGMPYDQADRILNILHNRTAPAGAPIALHWVDNVKQYITPKIIESEHAGSLIPLSKQPHNKVQIKALRTIQPETTAEHIIQLVALMDSHPSRARYTAVADLYKLQVLNTYGGFYLDKRVFESNSELPLNSQSKSNERLATIDFSQLDNVEVFTESFEARLTNRNLQKREFPASFAYVSPLQAQDYCYPALLKTAARLCLARNAIINTNAKDVSNETQTRIGISRVTPPEVVLDDQLRPDLKLVGALVGNSYKNAIKMLFQMPPEIPLKIQNEQDKQNTGYAAYDLERVPEYYCNDNPTLQSITKSNILTRTGHIFFDMHHTDIPIQ